METMYRAFLRMVEAGDFDIVERVDMEPRPERRMALPVSYTGGALADGIKRRLPDGDAWQHQAIALEALEGGRNVVVATGTASGKSLIFQLAVIRELLEGSGRAIVVYPLKSLLADQLKRWRDQLVHFGLPPGSVAALSGDVPSDDRLTALLEARVLVVTPDILQAWLMRNVATAAARQLLYSLRYLIIDEAHVYESVFGSNAAFLFRRLFVAQDRACRSARRSSNLQIIATTATIFAPADHLEALTGYQFDEIGEADDGSPSHQRTLLHIASPLSGSDVMLADLLGRLAAEVPDGSGGSAIAFHDSRQGVERICAKLDADDIVPYRGGFDSKARAEIESRMRAGKLRAVVATSALELGIDVAGFTIGANVGVPPSKKQFRQRLGRVGRAAPGIFAVLADRHAFTKLGSSFCEYFQGSVEPSYLYLENRFIQFAHAKCLLDEAEQFGLDDKQVPGRVEWPRSFEANYQFAQPGARRPREFDYMNQLGANSPHLNFPLRQIGEANYELKVGQRNQADPLGSIALNQAIREAYPGALYLHLKRPMKVREWRATSFDRSIRLEDAHSKAPTRPILHTEITIGTGIEDIIEGRVMSSASGMLAEVSMQVTEAVVGFKIGGQNRLYRDLRSSDPGMSSRRREFGTTGIVVRIAEDWFSGGTGAAAAVRSAFAEALAEILIREKSIAPHDLDYASTRIALYERGVPRKVTDTVVIYDAVYGGLRLTEPLYTDFEEFIDRLKTAASRAGSEAFIDMPTVLKLCTWFGELQPGLSTETDQLSAPTGELLVYAPGSRVCAMVNGMLQERVLLEPQLETVLGTQTLYYGYEVPEGRAYVQHDNIQPTGHEWRKVFWNPLTGMITEPESDDGGF